MSKPLVWSEQESGDWEACVAASYLTGMVYGGRTGFPLGIYTQAEREAIEATPDEPQNYATTDERCVARYGQKLRVLSTGTLEHAVTRVGVGLVLAGYGAMNIPTNATVHSIFYLPTSSTSGLVYDPLAPNKSSGVSTAASKILAWAKGPGANDAREVRENELGAGEMSESIAIHHAFPEGERTWSTKAAGNLVGYALDGSTKTVNLAAGSAAKADATADITQDPARAPQGHGFVHVTNGVLAGFYILGSMVNLAPAPVPPGSAAEWEAWFAEKPTSPLELWLSEAPTEAPE